MERIVLGLFGGVGNMPGGKAKTSPTVAAVPRSLPLVKTVEG
jgi:hypothetical protein